MKIEHIFNKEKLFFTSDNHFYHSNIIGYCKRPFLDVQDMNNQLIKNWNDAVSNNSDIVIAGDFIMSSNIKLISDIIARLNGRKHLVLGNHCTQNKFERKVISELFYSVSDVLEISVEDTSTKNKKSKFFISHYPHICWKNGYIHLHGHIHSSKENSIANRLISDYKGYDIGVDNNNYKPISYSGLKEIMNKKGLML